MIYIPTACVTVFCCCCWDKSIKVADCCFLDFEGVTLCYRSIGNSQQNTYSFFYMGVFLLTKIRLYPSSSHHFPMEPELVAASFITSIKLIRYRNCVLKDISSNQTYANCYGVLLGGHSKQLIFFVKSSNFFLYIFF